MPGGGFRRFQREHRFTEIDGHVLLTVTVRFSLPMGKAGRWFGRRVIVPSVKWMLRHRVELLRKVAESNDWKRYLQPSK